MGYRDKGRYDPLREWRATLADSLIAKGYRVTGAGGLPRDNPYVRWEPTAPNNRAPSPKQVAGKERERAIKRAYENELLMPWVPFWMWTVLWPEREDKIYGDRSVWRVVFSYRYPSDIENAHAALDGLARAGGADAVWNEIMRSKRDADCNRPHA